MVAVFLTDLSTEFLVSLVFSWFLDIFDSFLDPKTATE